MDIKGTHASPAHNAIHKHKNSTNIGKVHENVVELGM
jgi:hypothetical protein